MGRRMVLTMGEARWRKRRKVRDTIVVKIYQFHELVASLVKDSFVWSLTPASE